MDVNRALRTAVQTGTVLIGTKETLKAISEGKARLVVVASNAPDTWQTRLEQRARERGVPLYKFQGNNGELGQGCGKPFGIAALGVVDPGESDILALARQA